MSVCLRLLLIAVVAMFSGPRVGLAADGEWTVICDGAGEAMQPVLFDFETGEPVEPEVVVETCGFCLILDTSYRPGQVASAAAPLPLALSITSDDLRPNPVAVFAAGARAPPVLSEA